MEGTMDSITGRLAGLAFAVFLAGSSPLAAQPPAPVPETFSGSIDVRVVNVEAVVTDRGGRRVSGLTAKDFRLRVDGRATPIDSFGEVGGGKGGPAAVSAGPAGSPEAAAAPLGRNLLVFIDESFAVKTHRDVVLQKLATQLGQLDAADRVAVVAFDGERMAVLSDWTSNPAALAEVFAKAQLRPANGIASVGTRRMTQDDADFMAEVMDALDTYGDQTVKEGASGAIQPVLPVGPAGAGGLEGAQAILLARIPIAVTAAMRAFANAPGRKLMLLLSGGWPTLAVAVPVAGEANRLGYTLYPVDVPGLDTTFVANSAAYQGPSPVGQEKDPFERNSEYALEVMARATGGKASIDSARLEALPRTLEDTAAYYWLSFTPHWTGDGHSHRIQLEVSRPGLQVRSRRNFTDFSPATRAKFGAEDVLFFGGDPAGRKLGVLAGPPRKESLGRRRVPFLLTIPLLAFAAGREGRSVTDLVLAVQTEVDAGPRTRLPDTPVHLSPESAGTMDGNAHFKISFPLAQRSQRLVFTLRDPVSGTVIWGETRL